MKEVKPPKKPLIYYYGVALVVLLLINFLLVPLVARHAVQEVDYGLHDHDRKQGDRPGGGGGQPDHLHQQGRQQDL
jgi:hypothetical protein